MIEREKPTEVCILGDYLDMKAPARWSKGTADEYAADIMDEVEAGYRNLSSLRAVMGARKISYLLGNHEARLQSYLHRSAPALDGIVPTVRDLLRFDELDIVPAPRSYRVAPGVTAIHGEKLSSTQSAAGQSAYKERMRHGTSIVQGHTHRAGLGFDTQDKTRFWMECGHLLDIKQADYLSFGIANWQQAFGWLIKDGSRVTPGLTYVHPRGRFYFNGKHYGG